MTFENAHKKWLVKDIFDTFGHLNPLRDEDDNRNDQYYFRHLTYSTDHDWADYRTNSSLTIKRPYREIDTETLLYIFQNVCYDHNIKHEVHQY